MKILNKMTKFKTRQWFIIEDIKSYVKEWLIKKPNALVYIGCDSQIHGKVVNYAVSICMYEKGKGGHVISKKTTEKVTPNNVRLWEEVNKSIAVADELKELGIKITIHVDYNSDPNEKSNELYDAGLGYAMAMGYEAEGKPNSFAASKCADKVVR